MDTLYDASVGAFSVPITRIVSTNFILNITEIDDHWPDAYAPVPIKCLNPLNTR